jgi:hypothetical protein
MRAHEPPVLITRPVLYERATGVRLSSCDDEVYITHLVEATTNTRQRIQEELQGLYDLWILQHLECCGQADA